MFEQQNLMEQECPFSSCEIRVNKFARIAYKLQEIEKPTYLVRELSWFGKQEKQRSKFHLQINWSVEDFTLMGWSLHKDPRTPNTQQGNAWKVVREEDMFLQELQWQEEKTSLALP